MRSRRVHWTGATSRLGAAEGAEVLLEELGWNSYFAAIWSAVENDSGLAPARVVSQQRSLWRVSGEFGECWASASGKLRESADVDADWPAVGDWVAAQVPSNEDRAVLHTVL